MCTSAQQHARLQHSKSCMHAKLTCNFIWSRKRSLMSYLHSTRQQLLRLVALVQWAPKARVLAECVQQDKVLDIAAQHARMLQAAVDDMFAAHVERAGSFNPMFDVQTALEVLTTGGQSLRLLHASYTHCMPCSASGTPTASNSTLLHATRASHASSEVP